MVFEGLGSCATSQRVTLALPLLREGTVGDFVGLGSRAAPRGSHPVSVPTPQILLIAFLKVIDEGSHMVMLECPDTVNTLLHEFVLWEPDTPRGDGNGDTK